MIITPNYNKLANAVMPLYLYMQEHIREARQRSIESIENKSDLSEEEKKAKIKKLMEVCGPVCVYLSVCFHVCLCISNL